MRIPIPQKISCKIFFNIYYIMKNLGGRSTLN